MNSSSRDAAPGRGVTRRQLARRIVKVLTFAAFTSYIAVQAFTAAGPAIDIAFDVAVYIALVTYLLRRALRPGTTDRRR